MSALLARLPSGFLLRDLTASIVVFLVAMVLSPIVAFLERRRIHRGLAVALLALGFVAVFALALSFLIPPLFTQVDELIRQTPEAWNRVQAQVQAFGQRSGCDHEEFFQFREGHRLMARLVGQRAVRDLCSHEKAPGTPSH